MGDILLCARGAHAEAFSSILASAGRPTGRADSVDAARVAVRAGARLAIIDFDSLEGDGDACLSAVLSERPTQRALIIASPKQPTEAGALLVRYRLTNLLARNGEIHAGDFRSTVAKILDGDLFGVDKYLEPGAKVMERAIGGSSEKEELLESTCAFAAQAGVHRRVVEHVASVTDEMVTNAVYDAPLLPDGTPRYASRPRTVAVTLEAHERARLCFGADHARFAISVSDPFGALSADRVLDYLTKCFRRGEDQIDRKEGGAGVGLYFMFNSLSHFVINVAKGERTELIGLIDLTASYREFAMRSKSFNLFVKG